MQHWAVKIASVNIKSDVFCCDQRRKPNIESQ